jgi:hypothetical protein
VKASMARFDERMLNGMGVFAAIVQARSFAAAGDLLEMSRPGVSRAVARLEARLGIRLRTVRKLGCRCWGRASRSHVFCATSPPLPGEVRMPE